MVDSPPEDVHAVLSQLFAAGEEAISEGDVELAKEILDSAATVAKNKLPDGEVREQLCHGCERARANLSEENAGSREAATEYFAAMSRRLADVK